MNARGVAMVEALVACALLALGLLGATRLSTHALAAARQTRQAEQAHALAADALECAVARQSPCPEAASVTLAGTRYEVRLQHALLSPALTEVEVQVQWTDPMQATPRRLLWRTRVSALPGQHGLSLP